MRLKKIAWKFWLFEKSVFWTALLHIPSDLEISLGPRDVPRASPSGHLSGLGKSLGRRGCTTQYIPPLGSVRIQWQLLGTRVVLMGISQIQRCEVSFYLMRIIWGQGLETFDLRECTRCSSLAREQNWIAKYGSALKGRETTTWMGWNCSSKACLCTLCKVSSYSLLL